METELTKKNREVASGKVKITVINEQKLYELKGIVTRFIK